MDDTKFPKDNLKKKCSVCGFQSKNNSEVSFHVYPRDIKLREKWIDSLKPDKTKLTLPSCLIVCSQHFHKNDFIERPQGVKRRALKPNAVPLYDIISPPETKIDVKIKNTPVNRSLRCKKLFNPAISSSTLNDITTDNPSTSIVDNSVLNNDQDISEISIIDNSYDSPDIILHVSENDETINEDTQFDKKKVESFIRKMIKTDKQLDGFTGLHSFDLFSSIVNNIIKLKCDNNLSFDIMEIEDSILLTFIKLKLNITYVCLAAIFKITENEAQKIFIKTLDELEIIFSNILEWQKKFETIDEQTDKNYPIDNNSDLIDSSKVKFIISISSSGLISYVSQAFNNKINYQTEIGDDDNRKSDEGFEIDIECTTVDLQLIESEFKNQNLKFYEIKIESDESHVDLENVVRRIKIFKILNGSVPNYLSLYCEKIMHVICGVFNLRASNNL